MARERDRQRIPERSLRRDAAVRERRAQPLFEREHGRGVDARRREVQVHQLKDRLEVLRRPAAEHLLRELADPRERARRLARKCLLKLDLTERADTALRHQRRGLARARKVGLRQQRHPARARPQNENLIRLEVGRLEDHAHAVRERPVRDADFRDARRRDDRRRARLRLHECARRVAVIIRGEVATAHGVEYGKQLRRGGDRHPGFLRCVHRDHAIALAEPFAGEPIDVRERDGGDESLRQRILVLDAGNRFRVEEVADVLRGEGVGLALVAFGERALVRAEQILFRAIELGRGEPVLLQADRLGEHGVESAKDAAVGHVGRQRERVAVAEERAFPTAGADERRVGLLAKLVEAVVQHHAEQRLGEILPVAADGGGLPMRHLEVDGCRRVLGFLVGGDGDERRVLVGNAELRARLGVRLRRDVAEMGLDELLDLRRVEVADGDDGHEVRAVPVGVEPGHRARLERLERPLVADGKPLGVARALEEDRELLVRHARVGATAQSPFLDDDTALLFDLRRIQRDPARPVLEDVECLALDARRVGRDLQFVDRLVEARRGVDVRAEPHPDGLEVAHELILREAGRPVERHVLEEMGEPLLVVVLEDRAGVDDQAQLGTLLRLLVAADVVPDAVRQRTDDNARIARKGGGARGIDARRRRGRRRSRLAETEGRQGRDGGSDDSSLNGRASP